MNNTFSVWGIQIFLGMCLRVTLQKNSANIPSDGVLLVNSMNLQHKTRIRIYKKIIVHSDLDLWLPDP